MMASSPCSRSERARAVAAFLLGVALSVGCVGDAPTVVTCVLGTESCGGRCVDLEHNPLHCGGCGRSCGAGEACVDGTCGCLGEMCGEACVDVASHPEHCGACDAPCPEGRFCSEGVCSTVCSDGLTACAAGCIDTSTARDHCGDCDSRCPLGAQCVGGSCACRDGLAPCADRCVDEANDAAHCGACDSPCRADELCTGSACVLACGGEPCAPGEVPWGRSLAAHDADVTVAGVVVTTSGETVVAGTFAGVLLVSAGVTLSAGAGARELFVVRYDALGTPRWARQFGVAGLTQEAFALAHEGESVWLAGSVQGTVDFDGTTLAGGGRDALVVQLDQDGGVVTAERFGGAGAQRAKGVAPLGGGAFVVAGSFTDRLVRNGTTWATSDGTTDTDGFVMAVDAAGDAVWFEALADPGAALLQEVHEVAFANDTLAASARFDGDAEWAGQALTHAGGADGAVASFDALTGALHFTTQIAGVGTDMPYGLTVRDDGAVFVVGEHAGAATLLGVGGASCTLGTLVGGGGATAMVAKLGAGGCPLWIRSIDGAGSERALALSLGPAGDLALAGQFNGAVSFDGTPVLSTSVVNDGFVMRVSESGALVWAERVGGALGGFQTLGVAMSAERVVVAGTFEGTVFIPPTAIASAGGEDGFVMGFAR